MKLKPVYIEWTDPEVYGQGWHQQKELEQQAEDMGADCITVGLLLKKTRKYLLIVQTISGDQAGEAFKIPCSIVKSIKYL